MKIALIQMNVIPGRPDINVKRLLEFIDEAKAKECDIVVGSEMAISGYLIGDEYNNESFCKELISYNDVLREASKGIVLICGNIGYDKGQRNKDGRLRKYNAAYVFQNGKYVNIFYKSLLPCYRIFDDPRYFTSVPDIALAADQDLPELYRPVMVKIKEKSYNLACVLCEDGWIADYKYNNGVLNPTKFFIQNGADMIFNLSASPWTYGKNNARDNALRFIYEDCCNSGEKFVPFYYVNCVGSQNTGKNIVTFDGGTTIYNNEGKIYNYIEKSYEERLLICDHEDVIDSESITRVSKNKIAEKYEAIKQGLLHMKDILGLKENPKWVVGASGGVDSSLVIAILVDVFGKENVTIVNMPSKYNSQKTINVYKHLVEVLGVQSSTIPITEINDGFKFSLSYGNLESANTNRSLIEENDQARIRGLILAGLSARLGALFTCNANKLETALGYTTLYGDQSGGICPIADLTKTEIFDMARYINEVIYGKEVIPETLLPDELFRFNENQIQPSAELKENQVDPMKFGYHCAIIEALMNYQIRSVEDIMGWYLEGTLAKNLMIPVKLLERWSIDNPKVFIDDLRWFTNLMRKNIFKRIQSPPIIITSKTAFGNDRREAQFPPFDTKESKELEIKILAMGKYTEK